jgi:hypothetical protein
MNVHSIFIYYSKKLETTLSEGTIKQTQAHLSNGILFIIQQSKGKNY